MEDYLTIAKSGFAKIIQKHSRFIGQSFFVKTKNDAENCIYDIKKQFRDAQHNVWAYVLNSDQIDTHVRYSDDGEPPGTGGIPVLNVILNNNLKNTLIVVNRYFGGILLGKNGLRLCYKETAKKTIENSGVSKFSFYVNIKIKINYTFFNKIENLFYNNFIKIININYGETVEIDFCVKKNQLNSFENKIYKILKSKIDFEISDETYTIF